MKVRRPSRLNLTHELAIALLAVSTLACATLAQQGVKSRFEAANRVVLDPDSSDEARQQALSQFSQVVADLTYDLIEELPPEQRADAYVMRSYAEWRMDRRDSAKYAARRAQIDPRRVPGSHAAVMSELLPGLILSSQETFRWNLSKHKLNRMGYASYETNFISALGSVAKAEAQMAANTPNDTRAFVHYAKWRVASNWHWVVRAMKPKLARKVPKDQTDRELALLEVLGVDDADTTILQAVAALILEIPNEGTLRALAEAEASAAPVR